MLLSTGGGDLVEGNRWHDNFWGRCVCRACRRIGGANVLGTLLMQVRAELRRFDFLPLMSHIPLQRCLKTDTSRKGGAL